MQITRVEGVAQDIQMVVLVVLVAAMLQQELLA